MARKTSFRWYTNKTRKHLTVKAKKYLSEQIKEYWEKRKRKISPPVPKIYRVRVWGKVANYGSDGHKIFIESFAEKSITGKSNVDKAEEELIDILRNEIGNFFGFQLANELVFGAEQEEQILVHIERRVVIKYKYREASTWRTM